MSHEDDVRENGLVFLETESEEENDLLESEKYWEGLSDPIQAYIRDTKRYHLLTEKEKLEVFRRYRNFGDQETKDLLITSNLRLVVKIASGYSKRTRFPLTDLIQEGNVGLIKAVERYDPSRGVKFSYYAAFWIKALIKKYIMDNWGFMRFFTSERKRKLFHQLNREKERLLRLGLEVNTEKLAENLKVETKDILEMERILYSREISLDQPMASEDGSEPVINTVSSDVDTEKIISDKDLRKKGRAIFENFRKNLPKKERVIFDKRICCEEALTLESIGRMLNLSRERVRQLETEINVKLHKFKEKEETMALREASKLNGVTLSEVESVTREGSKARKIALLYFGLNDKGIGLKDKDIVLETGIPRSSVSSNISQIKQRIRDRREKMERGKEKKEPIPEKNTGPEAKPVVNNPDPRKADGVVTRENEEKEIIPDSESSDTPDRDDAGEPIRLHIERGSKKFEMNVSGGPVYDLLVKYLGL